MNREAMIRGDHVLVACPGCSDMIVLLSTAGPGGGFTYTLMSAPTPILDALDGTAHQCRRCGTNFAVVKSQPHAARVELRPRAGNI